MYSFAIACIVDRKTILLSLELVNHPYSKATHENMFYKPIYIEFYLLYLYCFPLLLGSWLYLYLYYWEFNLNVDE
jgi:hypothetical protein